MFRRFGVYIWFFAFMILGGFRDCDGSYAEVGRALGHVRFWGVFGPLLG